MTRIVEIIDFACQGITRPVICRATDGHEYVVKGNYAGHRALIAEWVAGRLGQLLGLPIPSFEQLTVDRQILDYSIKSEEVSNLGRGTLFGSRRVPDVVEIRPADVSLLSWEVRAKVLAFDWWVANPDRVWVDNIGNPNLLWDEGAKKIFVMDHNLAFSTENMNTFWSDHIFRDAKQLWNTHYCELLASEFGKALGQLDLLWTELPDDWTEAKTDLTLESVRATLNRYLVEPKPFWGLQ